MNVFTTDHPIVSQTSCFDRRAHPALSFVCTVFAIAFGLFPALFGWVLYEYGQSDFTETTGDQLTFEEVLILAGVIFLFCGLCAAAIVSIYRLLAKPKD